jgi:hypothetical protein
LALRDRLEGFDVDREIREFGQAASLQLGNATDRGRG